MDPPSTSVGDLQGGPFRSGEGPEKKVRVAVRIRPLLPQDGPREDAGLAEAAGSDVPSCCVTVLEERGAGATAAQYRVDSCWGAGASGRAIFEWEVAPLVRASFCCGHPATIFTHGASGSGKSHTMQGTAGDPGVAPLAVEQLLRLAAAAGASSGLRVSFMEIYLDRCHDLLLPGAELPLLEDARGRVHLPGLTQVPVACAADFVALWAAGCAARHTAATGVNAASSRSHSVLSLTPAAPHAAQVTLIDLAGFEDNRRTGNEGQRMRESARINSSLFALHKVLVGLTSGQPHVAYRDSKLTRLLRSSLAGPGRALLLLCLAPGRSHASAAHASLALAGLTGQLRLPPPAAPSAPPPRLHQQPAPPSSLGRAAERLAALQAWQEAKGRTPRPPASPHRRTRTPHATSPPSAAPPEGPAVPADAAARLAHVEALLAHRCPATLTAQQQGTPLWPDGAGGTAREPHLGEAGARGAGVPRGSRDRGAAVLQHLPSGWASFVGRPALMGLHMTVQCSQSGHVLASPYTLSPARLGPPSPPCLLRSGVVHGDAFWACASAAG
ncbi:hypothetical protein KFL_006910055 [Klebsormidium nitens]|uniref:Kinesin motor domain-containing protein n=1 Tax=Klebsormidium nitens TaxID=105231 RepID=A0A1Y1IL06_KLENI|nr:hypothetical protein KFL_006910055 [Klebsormidium nitens]|eukprot:GAQ90842.1 hypothetical protein KFL_006910055 [Klebsormidium nitens]